MSGDFKPEVILSELHLEGFVALDEGAPVRTPPSSAGLAFASGELNGLAELSRVQTALEEADWVNAESEAAEAVGLELKKEAASSGWWAVWDRTGQTPEVHGAAAGALVLDRESSALLYLDLRRSPRLVVKTARGGALVLQLTGDVLWAAPGVRPLAAPRPTFHVELEALEGLIGAEDRWLVGQLRALAASDEPWGCAVAVGRAGRLRVDPAAQREAILAAARRGEVDGVVAWPRRWAEALSAVQVEALTDHAAAERDLLSEQLDVLEEGLEQDEGWAMQDITALFLLLLRRRDDLESVCWVLRRSGRCPEPLPGLGELDARGALLHEALAPGLRGDDAHLSRVAERDPAAWWGRG